MGRGDITTATLPTEKALFVERRRYQTRGCETKIETDTQRKVRAV